MEQKVKKQLEEAMNAEFSTDNSRRIENFGIPASVIESVKRISAETQKIVSVMARDDVSLNALDKCNDDYETCKYVMANTELLKLCKQVVDVVNITSLTKDDLDAVCEHKGMSIKELTFHVMFSSVLRSKKDKN